VFMVGMSQHDNMARCLKRLKILEEGADVQVGCQSVIGGRIEVVKMRGNQTQTEEEERVGCSCLAFAGAGLGYLYGKSETRGRQYTLRREGVIGEKERKRLKSNATGNRLHGVVCKREVQ